MSYEYRKVLKNYFENHSLVESQIKSYDYFINEGIKSIVMNFNRDNIPDYLLETYDEINLKIEDVWLGEPTHIEVDGSITKLTPQIARLRGLTYAAPLYMKVSTTIGSQKEEFEVQIAKMPIMLKSSKCILHGKTKEELIELGEDPDEPGGYFIVNGTEKVVVMIEDLALNKFFIEDIESTEPFGRMFSERGVYKSLQEIRRQKDGTYTYTFGNFKNLPIFLLIKALGLTKDKDIVNLTEITSSDVIFQMSEFSSITDEEEAIELLAKKLNLVGSHKEKLDFYLNANESEYLIFDDNLSTDMKTNYLKKFHLSSINDTNSKLFANVFVKKGNGNWDNGYSIGKDLEEMVFDVQKNKDYQIKIVTLDKDGNRSNGATATFSTETLATSGQGMIIPFAIAAIVMFFFLSFKRRS